MGPASRRERERLALRAKIMDAARRLFAEKGYEAVTIRSLAEAIEYSPRTIYLHFKDKEDLLRQLCLEDYQVFGERIGEHLATEDPVERLLQMGRAYAEFALSHPNHYVLMFMSPPAMPLEADTLLCAGNPEADSYALIVSTVREAILQERFKPEFQDPDLIAQLLWASTHGVVSQHLTRVGEGYVPWRPIQERVAAMARAILNGLLRTPLAEPKKPAAQRKKT